MSSACVPPTTSRSWFDDPEPLQPLPTFLSMRRRPELGPLRQSLVPGASSTSSQLPKSLKKRVRDVPPPDIPDPALDYGGAWAGRCRVLLEGFLCAVPYRLCDIADMADESNEVLLVELSWNGGPGWLEDRGVAFVLKELQGGRPPVKISADAVRHLVQQRVNLTGRQARSLVRSIYSVYNPQPGLSVTLLRLADLPPAVETASVASAAAASSA